VEQLRRFSAKYRNARIELRTANSFEVSDMLRRGEVSLGLRYFGDLSPELISQQISEERIVVVCSAQHKWARDWGIPSSFALISGFRPPH
jgi:DNA-binding transcriptional LysR family regulator